MTIEVQGLSATRAGRTILHHTDFRLDRSERVGLVGSSGSGKSTLGHLLCDRLRTEGVAVAHVAQSPDEALDPLRTLAFHWQQAERALGVSPEPSRRDELLGAMNLDPARLGARPSNWSRGMLQRFVIAMAFIGQPDLLIMDEPTSALDPVVAASTMDLLSLFLKTTGTGLLLITHDLGLAAARVDRVLVMDGGRIVENASTAALLERPQSKAARALVAHKSWVDLPC